jgi:hypothetical protein
MSNQAGLAVVPLTLIGAMAALGLASSTCHGGAGAQEQQGAGPTEETSPPVGLDEIEADQAEADGAAGPCPATLPAEIAADTRAQGTLIMVWKSEFKLGFYDAGELQTVPVDGGGGVGRPACFDIAMGDRPVGPKRTQGDRKTPEGWYWVSWKIPYGSTRYYKALYVNYPNAEDAALALSEGRIDQRTHDRIVSAAAQRSTVMDSPLGSLIEIHGSGSNPRDWTLGCVALDNENIDYLYDAAEAGKTAIYLAP